MRVMPLFIAMLLSVAALAEPSPKDVKAAVARGDFATAESMLHEVVQAHPNSPKAHYEYAEVLAHNARYDEATNEMLEAKHLDPDIHFTNPDKFRSLEADLLNHGNHQQVRLHAPVQTQHVVTQPAPSYYQAPVQVRHTSSGMGPLGFIITLVIVIAVIGWLVSLFARRSNTVVVPSGGTVVGGGSYSVGGGGGYAGGYGSGPVVVNNGGGSGIGAGLGGFAAGVVVGDLLERAIDRPHGYEGGNTYVENNYGGQPGYGGAQQSYEAETYVDPGVQADNDMRTRQIDFGNDDNNSNSWDSGSSSSSSSWDSGSGSDSSWDSGGGSSSSDDSW